ncbi:MAG: caspase family protein, partial [Bryobacteraceae bacterium]
TQSLADVIVFERELGCEKLRPQIVRLRETLAPANSASIAGSENQPMVEAQRSSRRIEIGAPQDNEPSQNEPSQQVAALPPAETEKPALSDTEITRSIKSELSRVGCFKGSLDGEWNAASRRSLELFNKRAGTKLEAKFATLGALDAIKLKSSRVCPLICEQGFKAVGERCSRIVCAKGSFLNDDDECEKRRGRTPTASRDPDEAPHSASRPGAGVGPAKPQAAPAKSQAAGQIVCDSRGCRPVERGCRIEFRTTAQGGPTEGGGGNVQVCN